MGMLLQDMETTKPPPQEYTLEWRGAPGSLPNYLLAAWWLRGAHLGLIPTIWGWTLQWQGWSCSSSLYLDTK